MSTTIKKKTFNQSQILSQLRSFSGKVKEIDEVITLYEQGMTYFNNQSKKFLQYGANEIIYRDDYRLDLDSNDIYFNKSSSNSQDYQDTNTQLQERSKSLSQNYQKKDSTPPQQIQQPQNSIFQLKQKVKQLEQLSNQLREQNECLSADLKVKSHDLEELRNQLDILVEQNAKQKQNIYEKDDLIAKQSAEIKKLNEIELKHVEAIQTIKEQLEKKIEQITVVEADRNQLLERYLLEKTQFAEKMNQLNTLQEELNYKMSKLSEDEEYLIKRKLNFQTEVQKSGIRMPTLAPTIDEAKINLQQSEVPTKPTKVLLKQHKNEIYCIGQSLNGSLIASCGGDNFIKLYDPLSMNQQGQLQSPRDDILFLHLNFAPFSELILAGLTDKTMQLFNYSTSKLKSTFQGHNERVNVVSFTSEKEKVVSGSADRSLKIWDVNKVSQIRSILCGSIMRAIDYFQSEPHIVSGHNDGSIRLYSTRDSNNTKPVYNVQGVFENGITCVKISNCQNYILASSAEGFTLKVVDLRKNQVVKTFENQQYFNNHEFNKCCFGPDDKYVIAGSSDSSIFMFNFKEGTKKSILKNQNHQGIIVAVDYHNVSGNLYSGDSRGNLLIWN
ncbi:hypothetical protein ABPG74_021305 [Tetrahymena malaccensis]